LTAKDFALAAVALEVPMRTYVKAIIIFAFLMTCSWASAQTASPQNGTSPPANVDWFARVTSTLAIIVAIVAFLWGRLDKHHERKTAEEAKDPTVDFDLTRGRGKGNYDYELKIANRGDVSVQILSLACEAGAALEPDEEGELKNSQLINYNGLRVEPGEQEALLGEVNCTRSGIVKFTVKLRINERTQRTVVVAIARNMAAD
jgi:hypothetical protein